VRTDHHCFSMLAPSSDETLALRALVRTREDLVAARVPHAATTTGVAERTAQAMVAEIGIDITRFPTAGHLASWAGRCPGNDQSAGRRRSGRPRKGSKWLTTALQKAALAASRTKGSYLQARYRRLRPRIGHGRALGAVQHSILIDQLERVGQRVTLQSAAA
jgi:transposase